MSTMQDVARFRALAGTDYRWQGVRGGSRPPSKRGTLTGLRRNLRLWMVGAQEGTCFDCGTALVAVGAHVETQDNRMVVVAADGTVLDTIEFCHIVSRGPGGSAEGKGWLEGNIGVGHGTCNARQLLAGPVVTDAKRLDLVPTVWPAWADLAD